MITALTLLILSFIGMIVVMWGKSVEMATGKNVLHISNQERDLRLNQWYGDVMYQITHVSFNSLKKNLHAVIVVVENFFLRMFVRLGKKFTVIGDIVRGRNLPKNRGSVSFFLKNIEEKEENV